MGQSIREAAALFGFSSRYLRGLADKNPNGAVVIKSQTVTFHKIKGRGGKAGVSYEVRIEEPSTGLPVSCMAHLPALQNQSGKSPAQTGPMAQRWRDFKRLVVAPALAHPRGSRSRGKVLAELANRTWQTPDGKEKCFSVRNINRWVKTAEAFEDLARRKRKDAGKRKVIISREVDAAVRASKELTEAAEKAQTGDATLLTIRNDLENYAKSLNVHKNHQPKTLQPRVNQRLNDRLAENGIQVNGNSFELPRRLLQEWLRVIRPLRDLKNDVKKFHTYSPRGKTSTAGMTFNEVVQVDATKVDVYYRRSDGSPATPHMVTFIDVYTRHVFCSIFFLEKGKALCNHHVIQALIDRTNVFGLARTFVLDNGPEFKCLSWLEPGLLALQEMLPNANLDERFIVHNKAYNSQAKGMVERAQGTLNEQMFRSIKGWVGSNRMKAKSANYGSKLPVFPGSQAQLEALLQDKIAEYNALATQGDLDYAAPNDKFQRAIESGFEKVVVTPNVWVKAFSEEKVVDVRQGSFRHGGKWFCKELAETMARGKALIRVPVFLKWAEIPVYATGTKEYIGGASRQIGTHPLNVSEAANRASIAATYRSNVLAMGKGLFQVTDDSLKLLPKPEAPIGGLLSLSDIEVKQLPHLIEPEKARKWRDEERRIEVQDRQIAACKKAEALRKQNMKKA